MSDDDSNELNVRPGGVTMLAVFEVISGIFALFGSILLFNLPQIDAKIVGINQASVTDIFAAVAILMAIIGIMSFPIARGLLQGKSWAWTLALITSVIALSLTIAQVVIGIQGLLGLATDIIVQLVVMGYLFRPTTKAFFGK
jgi:uncharacterized membrane protein